MNHDTINNDTTNNKTINNDTRHNNTTNNATLNRPVDDPVDGADTDEARVHQVRALHLHPHLGAGGRLSN